MKQKAVLLLIFLTIGSMVLFYHTIRTAPSKIPLKYNLSRHTRPPQDWTSPFSKPAQLLKKFNYFQVENYLQYLFHELQENPQAMLKAEDYLKILNEKGPDYHREVLFFLDNCQRYPQVTLELKKFCQHQEANLR